MIVGGADQNALSPTRKELANWVDPAGAADERDDTRAAFTALPDLQPHPGGNQLKGAIPPGIGEATSLVRLRLGENLLAGEIPVAVGGMKTINFPDLDSNRLARKSPLIQEVDDSHNQLTGGIPTNFGQIDSLSRLVLAGNSLPTKIPPSLESLDLVEKRGILVSSG
uniref:Uncharacterized protein n=1 Tax=Leersia perrieri TaxID=77586 RepID=A0A0D9UWQ3_9ORYZ